MRVDSLTFLRFAAAVIVLFFHYGRETDLVALGKPFIIAGPAMVTFFFTLSGFVMVISHLHKTNETLRRYYVSRAARIFPIYFFALFLTAWLVLGYGINDKISLVLSSLFLQSWISPYPTAMNTPGWSLSVEVFFYLNFPLIIFLIRQYQPKTSHLVLLTAVLYLATQVILSYAIQSPTYQGYPSLPHDLVNYFPPSHLCSFMTGITGGMIFIRYQQHFRKTGLASYIVLLSAFYLVYFLLQNPHILQDLLGVTLAYGSSFYTWLALILIMAVAYADNAITRFLASPPLVFLGDISLSVYILQKPIHILYEDHISAHFDLGVNGDFYLFCTILIAIACITHLLIERRGSKLIFRIDKFFAPQSNLSRSTPKTPSQG